MKDPFNGDMSLPLEFNPYGLRQFRLFDSDDVEETQARISRVLKPHSLIPTGEGPRRRARMNLARFGGIGLTTIDFGAGMCVETGANSDYHVIILCLNGEANTRVDGETQIVRSTCGIMGEPGWRLAARFSADCEQFLVRVEARSIAAHTGCQPRFRRRIDFRDPGLRPWLEQVTSIVRSVPLLDCLQRNELAAVSMERLLIALLMAGQPWVDTATEDCRGVAPHSVRRAEAFIEEHAGEPIRLADIAAATGVPARTLHDGFRRFRDYSPIQYLAQVRLDRAREWLMAADGTTYVVRVALDCGFLHLGRFASAYRKRFGESPSATLRRASH